MKTLNMALKSLYSHRKIHLLSSEVKKVEYKIRYTDNLSQISKTVSTFYKDKKKCYVTW